MHHTMRHKKVLSTRSFIYNVVYERWSWLNMKKYRFLCVWGCFIMVWPRLLCLDLEREVNVCTAATHIDRRTLIINDFALSLLALLKDGLYVWYLFWIVDVDMWCLFVFFWPCPHTAWLQHCWTKWTIICCKFGAVVAECSQNPAAKLWNHVESRMLKEWRLLRQQINAHCHETITYGCVW